MALQEPETWAAIGGVHSINAARYDGTGGLAGFDFAVSIGGSKHQGVASRTLWVPRQSMVMAVESAQLEGQIEVELEPLAGGSRVEVTMTIRPMSVLATMAFPMITKAVGGGFATAVERFVASLN